MRPPAKGDLLFDRDLADLPPDLRWREWMGRVESGDLCLDDARAARKSEPFGGRRVSPRRADRRHPA